jgi:hypothetical protein
MGIFAIFQKKEPVLKLSQHRNGPPLWPVGTKGDLQIGGPRDSDSSNLSPPCVESSDGSTTSESGP